MPKSHPSKNSIYIVERIDYKYLLHGKYIFSDPTK